MRQESKTGFAEGFLAGLGDGVGPCKISKVNGAWTSACVPDASLNPTFPSQLPAGNPSILNFHTPLVSRATVWIIFGFIVFSVSQCQIQKLCK